MRRILVAILVLLVCPSAFAQEWIQYASKTDLFGVNFPSEPKVQDIAIPRSSASRCPATSTVPTRPRAAIPSPPWT